MSQMRTKSNRKVGKKTTPQKVHNCCCPLQRQERPARAIQTTPTSIGDSRGIVQSTDVCPGEPDAMAGATAQARNDSPGAAVGTAVGFVG
jgi:hypothetical protein